MWQEKHLTFNIFHIKFGNVIIKIGVFHTICSPFGALGKHMKGSGFEEIVVEAGVCASGSLQKFVRETLQSTTKGT